MSQILGVISTPKPPDSVPASDTVMAGGGGVENGYDGKA
jgi:hypothetical protein